MKYRSGLQTSYLILATLLDKKECRKQDFPIETGMNKRTVHRHVKMLEYSGLIKLSRKERRMTPKDHGKDRNVYGLTTSGLLEVLKVPASSMDKEEFDKNVKEIVERHTDLLPMIFGKWLFFREHKIEETILSKFKSAMRDYPSQMRYAPDGEMRDLHLMYEEFGKHGMRNWKKQLEGDEKKLKEAHVDIFSGSEEYVYIQVFLTLPYVLQKSTIDFLSILKLDKDITAYIEKAFERRIKTIESELENVVFSKRTWDSLNQDNR